MSLLSNPFKRIQNLSPTVAQTGNGNTVEGDTYGGDQITVIIDITAVSGGTPSAVFTLQRFDPISGKYIDIVASAAQTGIATILLMVAPGIAAVANRSVNESAAPLFRVKWVITGTTPSFTFTVAAHLD
jgi:hypothetical protein